MGFIAHQCHRCNFSTSKRLLHSVNQFCYRPDHRDGNIMWHIGEVNIFDRLIIAKDLNQQFCQITLISIPKEKRQSCIIFF